MAYALLLLAVLLTTASQIWQKIASHRVQTELADLPFLSALLSVRETWLAATGLAGSMLIWLGVLYLMDVSQAFPILSLSLVLVMIVSRYVFGERVSLRRWLGAALIVAGVLLVAGS